MFQKLKGLIPNDGTSKVLITASALHQGSIQYDDIEFKKDFSGFKAYRQSKLGVILVTRLLAKQSEFSGIGFYAVHPGLIRTQLAKKSGWFARTIFKLIGSSIEKGARTHIHLIDRPVDELKSGEYYAKSKVSKAAQETYDLENAARLMDFINPYIAKYLQ
jgi:NAD(P)-dependent dehydrogenase (short-subunit alcohol dehydrogenase family)